MSHKALYYATKDHLADVYKDTNNAPGGMVGPASSVSHILFSHGRVVGGVPWIHPRQLPVPTDAKCTSMKPLETKLDSAYWGSESRVIDRRVVHISSYPNAQIRA